ncbi:MAG: chromate transporter [Sphaerochaetaceae bacterium]
MLTMLLLYLEFFKIGLFAMGGGLAALPFLVRLASTHPEWLTMQEISNMIAVSESTPGPIGINMATYVGNSVGSGVFGTVFGGAFGGIVATLGEVTPSIIIILIVARILEVFKDNQYVKWAFYGLRATVIALIAYAAYHVYRVALFNGSTVKWIEVGFFAIFMILMLKFEKVHPLIWIFIAAIIGIIFKLPSLPS